MSKSSVHIEQTPIGQITVFNTVIQGNGFYVSYNSYDLSIYGSDTTALVDNDMTKFFILNGDHQKEYKDLINQGFNQCYEYFLAHIDQINRYSNKPIIRRHTNEEDSISEDL